MEFYEFKEMIENFVDENFCADGCKECHEAGHNIVPNDVLARNEKETDYGKAIKNLYNDYMSGK